MQNLTERREDHVHYCFKKSALKNFADRLLGICYYFFHNHTGRNIINSEIVTVFDLF